MNCIGIQIEIVARRLFGESDVPPQIRIDGMLYDEVAMLLEEGLDGGWKDIDGAAGDETMYVESPG
jgi:hypothetical protein